MRQGNVVFTQNLEVKVPFFLLLQITVLASPFSDRIQVTASLAQGLEQPEMLWVMGPVLAVVLIVIFVIAILLFKK